MLLNPLRTRRVVREVLRRSLSLQQSKLMLEKMCRDKPHSLLSWRIPHATLREGSLSSTSSSFSEEEDHNLWSPLLELFYHWQIGRAWKHWWTKSLQQEWLFRAISHLTYCVTRPNARRRPARRVHPSAWCNPFASTASTEEEAVVKFKSYAYSRADAASWLHPLSGMRLVAEVGIQGAHAAVLSEMLLGLAYGKVQNKMATDFHDEDVTDTDEMDPGLPYSPFSQLNANTSDECLFGDVDGLELTVRAMGVLGLNLGNEISDLVVRERQGCGGDSSSPTCGVGPFEQAQDPRSGLESDLPGRREQDGVASVSPPISPWRKEWASVASRVRSAGGNLFWELFAGVAILSRTFKEEEWRTGPPIDIVYTKAFNLMDPGFFMVVLGLIFESWVSVLHLGPPSLSFSMAINRLASKRIRTDERPAGRDNLSDKVRIGNELAQVAVTLAKAQMKVERWFQLEQRASSLMLHLPWLKELLADPAVFKAVRCICVDGAPWMKPTAIIANSRHILDLNAACPGCASHIPLQGKSPDGRSWTAVASPYWPAFALRMLRSWVWARGQTKSSSSAHLAGLRPDQDEDLTDALDASGFDSFGKRSRETVAARVGAGSQPFRRALPQLRGWVFSFTGRWRTRPSIPSSWVQGWLPR